MRRSILAAFVTAIALAIGFSAAASAAVDGNAQATAKKKAAKKNCGKKKAKKKAGKSLADSAAKKKASKCKAKPKKKAKAKPKGAALADGTYTDAGKGLVVTVTGNGTQANISGASSTCSGGIGIQVKGPIAPQGSTVKGTGSTSVFGGAGTVKWTLIVTPSSLKYQFDSDWTVQFPEQDPCQDKRSLAGILRKQ